MQTVEVVIAAEAAALAAHNLLLTLDVEGWSVAIESPYEGRKENKEEQKINMVPLHREKK